MEGLLNECSMLAEEAQRAYGGIIGKWTGCDWATEFGDAGLNLNGLHSSQAILLARATSGREAAAWRAAAEWLSFVEKEARVAEDLAGKALNLARSGKAVGAIIYIQNACAIEAKYHNQLVWHPLRDAIELALRTTSS